MLDITLQNFETDLITASQQQPVLLDIWAPWCGPCKALGPVLEKLEQDYDGRFALGKLNSDEQPEIAGQLSQMFGVRSIPFCVLFKDGQPVDGFVGALPEGEVRKFLDKHVASKAEIAAEEEAEAAQALLDDGDIDSALEKLQEAVAINPADDTARYQYLRALLAAGHVEEARRAYDQITPKIVPDARIVAAGYWLAALESTAAARPLPELQAAIAANKRDFDARYALAQAHFAAQRYTEAMDELLEILMRDKGWNDGEARKTFVAVLEIMSKPAAPKGEAAASDSKLEVAGKNAVTPSDPIVDAYRRRLSMTLF
jgi:putative thioredoxin